MTKNPDQGSFLLPGLYGNEHIPSGGTSFTLQETHSTPSTANPTADPEPIGVSVNVVERSQQIDRLLGYMGVMAKTLPAVEAEDNKDVEFGLRQAFGDEYDERVAEMREMYRFHKSILDSLFTTMWMLEEVKAVGDMSEAVIESKFEEDKAHFSRQFIKSDKFTTEQAQANRGRYRRRLDRQQMRYQQANIGAWPDNLARARRIATMKRTVEKARQKRRAA